MRMVEYQKVNNTVIRKQYMFGLERYLTSLSGLIRKLKIRNNLEYSKNRCHICGQICYNEKDLDIHTVNEHQNTTSTNS